jgi:uncharacterized membrane protein SpoIIM required for sporulation
VNLHEFISTRHAEWRTLENFIQQCARLSLSRVPLDQFRKGSLLYRRAVADLAYARMRYPGASVVQELERLLAKAHSVIYQARRGTSNSWWQFWLRTWPAAVRNSSRQIGLATAVFWIAALIGFLVAAAQPQFEGFFVSQEMRKAMESGHLWTEHVTSISPMASSRIATNNITVSLAVWAVGISFGVGTMWLLAMNGLMLGAIFAACLRVGLFANLAEFVVAHGALELPAIWISAGAGLVMAEPMLFPGKYSRSIELKQAARRSVQIVIGVIPMLLIAACVEGFVSPSSLSGGVKASLGALMALVYLVFIIFAPAPRPEVNL